MSENHPNANWSYHTIAVTSTFYDPLQVIIYIPGKDKLYHLKDSFNTPVYKILLNFFLSVAYFLISVYGPFLISNSIFDLFLTVTCTSDRSIYILYAFIIKIQILYLIQLKLVPTALSRAHIKACESHPNHVNYL